MLQRISFGLRRTVLVLVASTALWPALAAAHNAEWSVWLMKPDGSEVRLLAQVEGCTTHLRPRWSHDGKQIVFDAESKATGRFASYIVNADGTGLKKVGDFSHAAWSGDDKQLYFQLNGRTYVQNLDGSGRTELLAGGSPALSPDGSHLAVSYQDNLIVLNLVTGESRTLFAKPKEMIYYGFTWCPDGKRLAVVARPESRKSRELLYVSAEGEEQGVQVRLPGEMGGSISFSPDGNTLMVDSAYYMHVLDVDGTKGLVKINGQKGGNRDPAFSPDGQWIVFTSSRDTK